jgi:dTDP-4-dehydrorhamnose 3,5-epimerase
MKFYPTPLKGSFMIEAEPRCDTRGFFARTFCKKEFLDQGIDFSIVQCNSSYNLAKRTLRGLHYQCPPHEEAKLVVCLQGSIYDVMVDLRPESSTYCQNFCVELTPDNHKMLYVPQGFAHGYLTLKDDSVVLYFVSEYYSPEFERRARWNDPAFAIPWPLEPEIISERDALCPDFLKVPHHETYR